MNGSGSTKVHAASFLLRCSFIQMENADKAVCASCPVIAACRAHALAVQEPYGIWGGLSEDDRLAILGKDINPDISHAS